MNVLLIVTTGLSDVQAVIGDARRQVGKKEYRPVYQRLSERWATWRLAPSPDDRKGWYSGAGDDIEALCTPKLDAVLAYLDEHNIDLPTQALVFDTRSGRADDPDRAGEIVAARLAEALDECDVDIVTYVREGESISGTVDRDRFVNEAAVDRIDAAITAAVARADRVVAAANGGPSGVNALVDEIARLRSDNVLCLAVPESRDAERAVPKEAVVPPAERYRVRRQVLNLIMSGDLLGAAGVLAAVRAAGMSAEPWMDVVDWVKCFATAQSVPPGCTIELLKDDANTAVRAAIRVELALREGDIPRAVHATVQFFEAALWHWLHKKGVVAPNLKERKFRVPELDPKYVVPDEDELGTLSNTQRKKALKRPFTYAGKDLYELDDNQLGNCRIAEGYLDKPALGKFGRAIDDEVGRLRNAAAHGEPTIEQMATVREVMVRKKLWSDADPPRFLDRDLVDATLEELHVKDRADLADRLLAEVRDRILARD